MASQKRAIAAAVQGAMVQFNNDTQNSWSFGANWNNQGTAFETFVNNYLFPKLNETLIVETVNGNRFDWLAKEVDFIGQYSEEYVILDSVPISMDLSKSAELMLKRNYPKMATKLYQQGILKKMKFTLNNNDNRLNWQTIGDAITYAMAVYKKKISDINIAEEQEYKAMLLDYSLNFTADKRTVTSMQGLFQEISKVILNLQNNSAKHNETATASGGAIGRFTTVSSINDLLIVTTDEAKAYLLDTKLANTFQAAGIDLSNRIISFDDLGGVYKTNKDIKVTAKIKQGLEAMGDYQVEVDDVIPAQSVFTFDITKLFDTADYAEIKPTGEYFAMVFDIRGLRYKRCTKGMLKKPFFNGEFDETTHWIHYYSMKAISPFYNKVVITSA
nr:MAG TPA: Major capsid protein [Caudoviricetes sp.]